MKPRVSKLLITAGVSVLLVLGALIALPLWLPWVARPLASRVGVTYSEYRRNGYGAFSLRHVRYRTGDVVIQAEAVHAPTPLSWWRRLSAESRGDPLVIVQNWKVHPHSAKGRDTPERARPSVTPGSRQNAEVLDWNGPVNILKTWLPSASFTNGTVEFGSNRLNVPFVNWRSGQLSGRVTKTNAPPGTVDFEASFAEKVCTLRAGIEPSGLYSEFSISTNTGGYSVAGSTAWQSNCVYLAAEFSPGNLIPDSATLTATNILVPPDLVSIPEFGPIQGEVHGHWENGGFTLEINGTAPPEARGLPPVTLEFQIAGTTNHAVIRAARVSAPGLDARLAHDVSLVLNPPYLAEPAQLFATADFEKLGLLPVSGHASANVFLTPNGTSLPLLRFFLTASNVRHKELQLSSLNAEGTLLWPELQINRLQAKLWPETYLGLSGSCNLSNRSVTQGAITLNSSRPPSMLEGKVQWGSLNFTGTLQGPVAAISHEGTLKAREFKKGSTVLSDVNLAWTGRMLDFETFKIQSTVRSNTTLALDGSVSVAARAVKGRIETLVYSTSSIPSLVLEKPVSFAIKLDSSKAWNGACTPVVLAGSGGRLDAAAEINWPTSGKITGSGTDLSTMLFRDFGPLPEAFVDSFTFSGAWSNGPIEFQLSTAVHGATTNLPFSLEARIAGNAEGIIIQQAALVSSNSPLVLATGLLPVSINPGQGNPLAVRPDGPLQISAKAQPHPLLWNYLGQISGWRVESPELLAEITGTWSAPHGRAQFRTKRISAPGKTNVLELGPLNLVVEAEAGKARVKSFEVEVQGQLVTATAELPLKPGPYRTLADFADLGSGSATIRIQNASMAALAPLAPKVLTSEGSINMDLTLRPGFKLDGTLAISGARTMPIGTLGPVRDINLRLEFNDNFALLEQGGAQIGGVPVALQGRAGPITTNLGFPAFSLIAKGSKVPLARQPQAIIRGDVDVLILRTNDSQPIITGEIRMTDSHYLSDLEALVPGKVVNPRERPPYFSISDKEIANWRFDVRVVGDRGLRFRTPVIAGEVSPNIRLSGTLAAPIAVGNVRVDSGVVRFPFGSLTIQQGLVTTTTQDPAHPQIALTASARQFGYDIRLNVSGSADKPIMEFSSTPPLTSDQILMMLTAGEIPRGMGASLSSEQRAQAFAMFLGRDLLAKFGMGGGPTDRLIVRSGEEFSEEGRPTYDVEFKLSPRWSLTGEYDRFGDYNAGVKWRVYSK